MPDTLQDQPSSRSFGINLGRCMTSEVFELTADGAVSFFVHKDVLTAQSEPFCRATTGPWQESSERRIDLKDWDSDSVARLVEFLYSQDYTCPDPRALTLAGGPASGDLTSTPPDDAASTELNTDSEPAMARPMTPPGEWLDPPQLTHRNRPPTDVERLAPFAPAKHDFNDVLLAHAKVYALANYKGVHLLRSLARSRLHVALAHLHPLTPGSHIIANIVDLVSYAYTNTDTLVRSEEPLRKIISQYIALNLAVFRTDLRAVELLTDGGDFVHDLLGKVCSRLADPNGYYCSAELAGGRYISGLTVVYGTPPSNHITEVNGSSANISWPDRDMYKIWLVPEYTLVAEEAYSRFNISTSPTYAGQKNLDRTHGTQMYLHGMKDLSVVKKITELALVRMSATAGFDLSAIRRFDGMGTNLRHMTKDDPLYLVWRTRT